MSRLQKLFAAAVALGGLLVLHELLVGPRMLVQPHIRSFQVQAALPPPGTVPVAAAAPRLPARAEVAAARSPLQPSPANSRRGSTYYRYYCQFCHGAGGRGDGPVGQSYVPRPADLRLPRFARMSDGELLRAMLAGVGHEPVLPRLVPDEHRWYLVLYLRELAAQKR